MEGRRPRKVLGAGDETMKTHQAWMLATMNAFAIGLGLCVLVPVASAQQGPVPLANASYASFSAGQPVIQQVNCESCGACDGAGCGICGITPTAGGFRVSQLAHAGAKRDRKCSDGGCGLFGGGGGLLGGGGGGGILGGGGGACGPAGCGPAGGGILGGLGGGLGGGLLGGAASGQGRYGGFGSMVHGTQNGPFGGGGCCTPIWYDFSVSFVALQRDSVANGPLSTNAAFASGATIDPEFVALSLGEADVDVSTGVMASYALLIGPSTNVELNYLGVFGDDGGTATGNPDGLYSVFGDFGAPRVTGLDVNGNDIIVNGFPQTVDNATRHSIAMDSDLHNLELNVRRRWTSAGCLLHGSYLAGVRYVSLNEDLRFEATVPDGGFLNYDIEAENEAVGFQLGGNMFVCVSPRLKLGVEMEGGIYGNDSTVTDTMNTFEIPDGQAGNPLSSTFGGTDNETDVAFVGELNVTALFRITPRLTLRGGYTLLYLDNFALAQNHFNTGAPVPTRPAIALNNKEEVLYDGGHVGITWMW